MERCYKYLGWYSQSTPLRVSISFIFLSSQRFVYLLRLSSSFLLVLSPLIEFTGGGGKFYREEEADRGFGLVSHPTEFIEAHLIEASCVLPHLIGGLLEKADIHVMDDMSN